MVLFFLIPLGVLAQKYTGKRAEWFVHDRFGMFIHWGLYSGAEGYWKGEKLRYGNDYAEWIQYRNRIAKEEYLKLTDRFDWDKINPEEWVILAKEAGMKYVTITAKHHDGFALWNSASNDYNIYEHSKPKRDIIKELSAACKKHGLKMGLYYSHWVDWEHPDGWDHTKEIYGIDQEAYDGYWQEKVIPQMRELLTQYEDIGMIWFDMWFHHSETVVSKEQLVQIKELIRELQPDCLINSRLGLSVEEDSDVDFRTLGDNQLGKNKLEYPWQTPATVAHSWGFHATENQWKSTSTLLRSLIGNVGLNGNFMLNIGPRANGEVPYEIETRLKAMGDWLKTNGEAIYGSGAFDLPNDQHDWGLMTYKLTGEGTHKTFLHLFNWPLNKKLKVSGIVDQPRKIYLLADKQKEPLNFDFNQAKITIALPDKPMNQYVAVVVMEFDDKPQIERGLAAELNAGGYSLDFNNTVSMNGETKIIAPSRRGSIPRHINVDQPLKMRWKIFIDKPGDYFFDTSYSNQATGSNGQIMVTVGNDKLIHQTKPTGKTVGEANNRWVIDNFASNRMGHINFGKSGFYDVELKLMSDLEKKFKWQWLWLEPIN